MKYFIFKLSINIESSVCHPTKYLLGSTARDKDKHLRSILASDFVRVKVWNVSNAEASDLWFKCQFLEIKREKDELIRPIYFQSQSVYIYGSLFCHFPNEVLFHTDLPFQ